MRTAAIALLVLSGCPEPGTVTDDVHTDTASHTDTDTDSDTDTDTDTASRTSRPRGTITDSDGQPVFAFVNICRDVCLTVETSPADGTYTFDVEVEPGEHWFYVVPPGQYPDLAATSFPIALGDEAEPVLDLQIPAHSGWTELPAEAAPLTLAEGLVLTAGLDSLSVPDRRTRVAGAWADPRDLLLPIAGGTVLGVAYLNPHDAKPSEGRALPLTIEDRWSLGEGATVEVYTGQYGWVKLGDFQVQDGRIEVPDLGVLASVAVVIR